MAKRFYEIFRAGSYPQGNFDADDIKQIADNYDPSFLEAPITVDHQFGGPAYGWIEELKAEGDRLLATFKDVSDHLKSMVATKSYKRHSIELYNDLDDKGIYLRALSMLGGASPQVKGLEPIEFSTFSDNFPDDESKSIEFEEPVEPGDMELSELFSAWLDVLDIGIEEFREQAGFDQDAAAGLVEGRFDEEVDAETLEQFNQVMKSFQGEDAEISEEVANLFKDVLEADQEEQEEEEEPVSFADTEEYTEMQERIQTLENQLESERDEKEDFKSKAEQMRFDQRKSNFVSFLEKNIKDSPKLPPKLKDKAVEMFGHLDGIQADEDDEKSPLELFKDIIDGLPEIDLNEKAKKKEQPKEFSDPHDLAAAATKYMEEQREKGNHVGPGQAVTHVKNQRSKN